MSTTIDFNDLPFLKDLTTLQRSSLHDKTSTYSLGKDEVIFHEGDVADYIYFLLEGKVNLQTSTFENKSIVTDVLRTGDFFGWSGVFEGAKMTATAICASDVKLAKIPRDDFMNELTKHSDTGIQVMIRVAETISRRLRESRSRLALHLSGSLVES